MHAQRQGGGSCHWHVVWHEQCGLTRVRGPGVQHSKIWASRLEETEVGDMTGAGSRQLGLSNNSFPPYRTCGCAAPAPGPGCTLLATMPGAGCTLLGFKRLDSS